MEQSQRIIVAPGRDAPATTWGATARLPLVNPGMSGWTARQLRARDLSLVGRVHPEGIHPEGHLARHSWKKT